jgi:hypothetical protein
VRVNTPRGCGLVIRRGRQPPTTQGKVADRALLRARDAHGLLHAPPAVVRVQHDIAAFCARDKPPAIERGKSNDAAPSRHLAQPLAGGRVPSQDLNVSSPARHDDVPAERGQSAL